MHNELINGQNKFKTNYKEEEKKEKRRGAVIILEQIESTSPLELAPIEVPGETTIEIPDLQPSLIDPLSTNLQLDDVPNAHRKRHRTNLQDVSNKQIIIPPRASGRIRIKMEAAAAAEHQKKQEVPSSKAHSSQNSTNNNVKLSGIKHRKRRQRQKIEGSVGEIQIDVKRPNSVLVDTSIRALLTNYAFSQLSPENQKILIESLPLVDRPQPTDNRPIELSPSSINNEFFNRACIEWRDRLAYGEFTNEHQTKLKAEQERDKSKIDPWKARNFEGIWGIKMSVKDNIGEILEKSAMEVKGRMEQGDFEIPEGFINESLWKSEEVDTDNVVKVREKVPEIIKIDENGHFEEEHQQTDELKENLNTMSSPSISTSIPTQETVTSTQPDDFPERKSLSPQKIVKYPEIIIHHPVIAEATSSADDNPMFQQNDSSDVSNNFIADDDDEIASHVELSSDGMPTNQQWYHHEQEHDYLKNSPEIDHESNVMDMDALDEIVDNTGDIELIENDNAQSFNIASNTRISNYDAELPQEIFHSAEHQPSPILINNYVQQEDVILDQSRHYNHVGISHENANESPHYSDFMLDEAEIEMGTGGNERSRMNTSCHEEIHVPKNVKLLSFPTNINYINNEKYIIEEPQSQHISHQSNSRTNGATIQPTIQNSYFVGGPNFTYISKMGNKTENMESTTRIIKQETNNNVKQRIIYEISTEPPKVTYEQATTHHVTYATPSQPEIYHKMVNHNGTTTIYTESTGPPQKKTIIQRKKPTDPYTVQVALQSVANNNTIILTPIGNTTTQQVQPQQQQQQKSIVHIHRTNPLQQTSSVQFLPQTTFLKKQTVLIPQIQQSKSQQAPAKYTTVIRAPTPQIIQTQQLTPIVSNHKTHAKPIQKQKVIMSTSSLQQYRSFNHKNAHGSRKQLHPQHIIRPTPQTTTVIQSMVDGSNNGSQSIPVMISSGNATETYTQIPTQQIQQIQQIQQVQQVIKSQPTVVTINSGPSNSIFLRQNRPQQTTTIYQAAPTQQIFQQPTPIIQQQHHQQQLQLQPRMRTLTNHRPPPGAINLERSYQICQAVIQNSPNRHQLNCQLKPPPTTLLGTQKKF